MWFLEILRACQKFIGNFLHSLGDFLKLSGNFHNILERLCRSISSKTYRYRSASHIIRAVPASKLRFILDTTSKSEASTLSVALIGLYSANGSFRHSISLVNTHTFLNFSKFLIIKGRSEQYLKSSLAIVLDRFRKGPAANQQIIRPLAQNVRTKWITLDKKRLLQRLALRGAADGRVPPVVNYGGRTFPRTPATSVPLTRAFAGDASACMLPPPG